MVQVFVSSYPRAIAHTRAPENLFPLLPTPHSLLPTFTGATLLAVLTTETD